MKTKIAFVTLVLASVLFSSGCISAGKEKYEKNCSTPTGGVCKVEGSRYSLHLFARPLGVPDCRPQYQPAQQQVMIPMAPQMGRTSYMPSAYQQQAQPVAYEQRSYQVPAAEMQPVPGQPGLFSCGGRYFVQVSEGVFTPYRGNASF